VSVMGKAAGISVTSTLHSILIESRMYIIWFYVYVLILQAKF